MAVDTDFLAPPPPVRQPINLAKVAGYLFVGLWIALAAGILWSVFSTYDPDFVRRYVPRILGGLVTTLQLVATSMIIGAALAIPLTFGRLSQNRIIKAAAFGYVYFFRGTPLLAQVFLIYYGAGQFRHGLESVGLWWFFREAYFCAILSFSMNTAAYQAEILKGAILNVPRGQTEAAMSMGLSKFHTFRLIILPQALITALRPFGNEIILMIKGSAIASVITVFDLMGETRLAFFALVRLQRLSLGSLPLSDHGRNIAPGLGPPGKEDHPTPGALTQTTDRQPIAPGVLRRGLPSPFHKPDRS